MKATLLIIISYLVGSISFAMLIAKAKGIDLRKIGSGNLGATNLSRAAGKKWGQICFGLDVLKGFVPAIVARLILFDGQAESAANIGIWIAVGIAAILGHVFPFYLKFKGGKGVATSFGVVLGICPYYTIPGITVFAIWAAIVLIWRYISLGSVIAAGLFPLILLVFTAVLDEWYISTIWPLIVTAFILGALVIVLHRKNIKRLINGNENKILQK
ncbi:MAG: glycerol-3-phosphate 1-O-acyltransferase PlsY [Anaerohalosphaeraceae bacterium]|nr:glycerol-3-phosphate 1-O-acyltransferase PlsY [Anaerohalosphaeraceae bacterium]